MYSWQEGRLEPTVDSATHDLVEAIMEKVCLSTKESQSLDDDTSASKRVLASSQTGPEPYCGIYSIYGAAKLLRKDPDLYSLVNQAYISSPEGSTVDDLLKAAADLGLHAKAFKGIAESDLRRCKLPIILHVKRDKLSEQADHYVILAPSERSGHLIIDLPHAPYKLEDYDLGVLGSGVGIVVSTTPILSFPENTNRRVYIWTGYLLVASSFSLYIIARLRKRARSHRLDIGT